MLNPAALPPAVEIDHAELRSAVEKRDGAVLALREAQQAARRVEAELEQAKQLDAVEGERALAAGEALPRRRHTVAAEKHAETVEHDLRVAQLAVGRAGRDLQAAIEKHGDAFADDVEQRSAALDVEWGRAVAELTELHQQRSAARALLHRLGRGQDNLMVRFSPGALADSLSGDRLTQVLSPVDIVSRHKQRLVCSPDQALEALSRVGETEVIPEFIPGGHIAEQFKRVAEHARDVERGFSDEDVEQDKVGAIGPSYRPYGAPGVREAMVRGES